MLNEISERDLHILQHMVRYCGEIEAAIEVFGNSEELFKSNPVYRNAVSMPIQQIGELAKHLSEPFIETYPEIPWKNVKGMREWFAHQYLNMNPHIIWCTATADLPPLREFCEKVLSKVDPDHAVQ